MGLQWRLAQYLVIRYMACLTDADAAVSLGSGSGRRDNALVESLNGFYKTEVIRPHGPWWGLDDVEYATLEYVDCFDRRRLRGQIGMIPPAEFEGLDDQQGPRACRPSPSNPGLQETRGG